MCYIFEKPRAQGCQIWHSDNHDKEKTKANTKTKTQTKTKTNSGTKTYGIATKTKDGLHNLDGDSAKKGRTTEDTRGQDAHTGDNHKSPKKQIEQIFSRNSISRSDRESQIFSTNRRTCVRFFGQILEREKNSRWPGVDGWWGLDYWKGPRIILAGGPPPNYGHFHCWAVNCAT